MSYTSLHRLHQMWRLSTVNHDLPSDNATPRTGHGQKHKRSKTRSNWRPQASTKASDHTKFHPAIVKIPLTILNPHRVIRITTKSNRLLLLTHHTSTTFHKNSLVVLHPYRLVSRTWSAWNFRLLFCVVRKKKLNTPCQWVDENWLSWDIGRKVCASDGHGSFLWPHPTHLSLTVEYRNVK